MAKAAELRSEAERLRRLALIQTDPRVTAEINVLFEELERQANELADGDGTN